MHRLSLLWSLFLLMTASTATVYGASQDSEWIDLSAVTLGEGPLKDEERERVSRYVEQHGGTWQASLLAAGLYAKLGMMQLANEQFEQAYRLGPGHKETLVSLIRWKLQTGDIRRVQQLMPAAEEMLPENFSMWILKGALASHGGDAKGARESLNRASEAAMSMLPLEKRRVIQLMRENKAAEAVSQAEKLVSGDNVDETSNLLLVAALMQAGDQQESLPKLRLAYRRAPLRPLLAQVYARVLLSQGRMEEALEPMLGLYATNIISMQDPGSLMPAVRSALTNAPLQTIDDYSRTIGAQIFDRHRQGQFHYSLGTLAQQAGREDVALQQYKLAIASSPDDANAQKLNARIHRLQSILDNAHNDPAYQFKKWLRQQGLKSWGSRN